NDKLNIISFEEKNIQDKSLPYEIEYIFENDNYVVHAGDETYLNMFLHKPFIDLIFDEERKTTVDLDRLQQFKFNTSFTIPGNTEISYIFDTITYENDFIKQQMAFFKSEGNVNIKYTIENKKTYIKPSEDKGWIESPKNV